MINLSLASIFKSLTFTYFLASFFLISGSVNAAILVGRVVRIADGDTITMLLADNRQVRIRLAEIDAPENSQPYGAASKQILSSMVFGKTISANVTNIDRYGRSVARLNSDGVDVNAEMVRRGAAWAYTRYQSDGRFAIWEREARAARRGIWGLQRDQIEPPWEWRAQKRGVKSISTTAQALAFAKRSSIPSTTSFTCSKRYCRQLSSCAEAVFALRQCGISRLDADHDGKPCEKLCS